MDKFHESNPSDHSSPPPAPSDACDLSVKSSRLHRDIITGDENSITAWHAFLSKTATTMTTWPAFEKQLVNLPDFDSYEHQLAFL